MSVKVEAYLPETCYTLTAGEAITEGDLVGCSTTASTAYKADRNATQDATHCNRAIGVAVRSVASGGKIAIAPIARVTGLTLTAGALYYTSATAGAYDTASSTDTEIYQGVGIAVSTTTLFVNVSAPYVYQTAAATVLTFL